MTNNKFDINNNVAIMHNINESVMDNNTDKARKNKAR